MRIIYLKLNQRLLQRYYYPIIIDVRGKTDFTRRKLWLDLSVRRYDLYMEIRFEKGLEIIFYTESIGSKKNPITLSVDRGKKITFHTESINFRKFNRIVRI